MFFFLLVFISLRGLSLSLRLEVSIVMKGDFSSGYGFLNRMDALVDAFTGFILWH